MIKTKKPESFVVIGLEPVSLDIQKAAAFLGTSPHQIRTLIRGGDLRPIRLGKRFLLLVEDLRNFIRSRQESTT